MMRSLLTDPVACALTMLLARCPRSLAGLQVLSTRVGSACFCLQLACLLLMLPFLWLELAAVRVYGWQWALQVRSSLGGLGCWRWWVGGDGWKLGVGGALRRASGSKTRPPASPHTRHCCACLLRSHGCTTCCSLLLQVWNWLDISVYGMQAAISFFYVSRVGVNGDALSVLLALQAVMLWNKAS